MLRRDDKEVVSDRDTLWPTEARWGLGSFDSARPAAGGGPLSQARYERCFDSTALSGHKFEFSLLDVGL